MEFDVGTVFRMVALFFALADFCLLAYLNRPSAVKPKVIAGDVIDADLIVKAGYAILFLLLAFGFAYGAIVELPVNPVVYPVTLALGLVFWGKSRLAVRAARSNATQR